MSKIIQGKQVDATDLSNMLSKIKELFARDDYKGFFDMVYPNKSGYVPNTDNPFNMIDGIYNQINDNIRNKHDKLLKNDVHVKLELYYLQYIKELFSRIIKTHQAILKIKVLNVVNGVGTDSDKLKRIHSEILNGYKYRLHELNNAINHFYLRPDTYGDLGVVPVLDEEEFYEDVEREYIRAIDEHESLTQGYSNHHERLKELSNRINLEVAGDEILYEKAMNQEYVKRMKINRDKLDDIYKKITKENNHEDILNNVFKESMLINMGVDPDEAREKIFTITEDELVGMGFTSEEVEFFMPKKTIKEEEPQLTPLSSTSSYMTATEDEPFYDASSEYIGGKQKRKKKYNKNKKTKKKQQKKRRNTRKNYCPNSATIKSKTSR